MNSHALGLSSMLYPQVLKPLHRVYLGDKSFMARTGELELLG